MFILSAKKERNNKRHTRVKKESKSKEEIERHKGREVRSTQCLFAKQDILVDFDMNKALVAVGALLVVVSGFAGYGGAAAAQHSRIQRLENANAELKGKLDNIQDLVTEAKDDLDDVEDEVQSEESCEDTDAYSDAADVEDKLNEIDSEASTEGPRDSRTPVPIALRWRGPLPFVPRHRARVSIPSE